MFLLLLFFRVSFCLFVFGGTDFFFHFLSPSREIFYTVCRKFFNATLLSSKRVSSKTVCIYCVSIRKLYVSLFKLSVSA